MAKRIYLVRHGETLWNLEERLQGNQGDSDLTDKGIEQAHTLGVCLAEFPLEVIVSSPLGRALQTAKLIQKSVPHLPIVLDELAREMHFGEWEGRHWRDIETSWPEQSHHWEHAPELYMPTGEGGESFQSLRVRAGQFLEKLWRERSECHILVVSHAVLIKSLLAIVADVPVSDVWNGTPQSRRASPFVFEMHQPREFSFLPGFEAFK